MESYTAPPIAVAPFRDASHVELVFGGVEQAGPSFEARVFLNHPDANVGTALTPETGYAGSFHVYGYGEPVPPALAEAKRKQRPSDPPLAPIEKRLRVDEAALRTALEGSDELTVTVVPVPSESGGRVGRPFESVTALVEPAS